MANLFPMYTKVAGVSKRNEDGTSRQDLIEMLSVGDQLWVLDESSPEYPEAIALAEPYGGGVIGFLPAKDAQRIREACPDLDRLVVKVRSMGRPAPDAPIGVSLVVSDHDVDVQSPEHVISMSFDTAQLRSAAPRQQARPAPQPPRPKKRRHFLRWILIILAVLAVLAFIGSQGRAPAP